MIQNLIVAVIILAAIAYIGYSLFRSVVPGEKPGNACGGCTECELKNLKKDCGQTTQHFESGLKNKVFKPLLNL
jgi:hypothetical protein